MSRNWLASSFDGIDGEFATVGVSEFGENLGYVEAYCALAKTKLLSNRDMN